MSGKNLKNPFFKLILVCLFVLVASGIDESGAVQESKENGHALPIPVPVLIRKKASGHKTRSEIITSGSGSGPVPGKTQSTNETGGKPTATLHAAPANLTDIGVGGSEKEKGKDKEVETVNKDKESVTNSTVNGADGKDKELINNEDSQNEMDETAVEESPKPGYMAKVKSLFRRLLDILGLVRQNRKSRLMNFNVDNSLDSTRPDFYTEEVRATVGALLGKRDCMRRAICGAGAYLKNIQGKEVIIIILERIAPDYLVETVNQIKEAAIYRDKCNYRCMDD